MSFQGLLANGIKNPSSLIEKLKNINTTLSFCYVFNGITSSNGIVTGWNAAVGTNLTSSGTPEFGLELFQNQLCLSSNPLGITSLNGSVSSTGEVWAVAGGSPVSGDQGVLIKSTTATLGVILRVVGTSTFYTANGWAHVVDGVATETVPTSGNHVYQAYGSAFSGPIVLGGQSTSGSLRSWKSPIAIVFGRATRGNSTTDAANLRALQSFFRL